MTDKKPLVLFIFEDLPYPPRRTGYSVRFYPLLQFLATRFHLDLALIIESNAAEPDLGELRTHVRDVILVRTPGVRRPTERIAVHLRRVMPRGVPYDVTRYGADSVVAQLMHCDLERYSSVVWVSHTHFLTRFLSLYQGDNVIVDAVDSVTLWKSAQRSSEGAMGRLKIAKTRRWELSLCRRAKRTFYISAADAGVVAPRVGRAVVEVMPNGIYFGDYRPANVQLDGPSIGYLGNMGYPPNVDAAQRVARVFDHVKREVPEAKLYIIGRDPDPAVVALGTQSGIVVTGEIDDIWGYINAIDVFVLPVFQGAGLQNKLLEVMYAGKPAVVSSVANRGVGAEDGVSVVVANSEQSMVNAAVGLLRQPDVRARMGQAGKLFVEKHFSWDSIGRRYSQALESL